jgi:hypothetical protein
VVKKLKAEDGKARTMATAKGIADKHILKNDTILCPVSQFSFSAATIKKKFGGWRQQRVPPRRRRHQRHARHHQHQIRR